MEKKLCEVHFFKYSGVECPFCVQERVSKFLVKKPETEKKVSGEITEDMIEKLKNKFS